MLAKIFAMGVLAGLVLVPKTSVAENGYLSAGIGGGADLGGTMAETFQTQESSSARVSVGQRVNRLAIEASLYGAGLVGNNGFAGMGEDYKTLSLGLGLKYFMTLLGPLEAYGKAGVNKTWLRAPSSSSHSYDGRGWDLGAGLQFTFAGVSRRTALWLDYTHQMTDLHEHDKRELDGSVGMTTIGISVGM